MKISKEIKSLRKRIKKLRWFGLNRKYNGPKWEQDVTESGFKYHMNDIAASIGISNIPEARQSVISQRSNSKRIIESVNNPNLIMPSWDESCSYWLFSMHVVGGRKKEFQNYLEENNISSSPVHFRNDLYSCVESFREKELQGVTSFDETQICIPNGWWLTEKELSHITTVLNLFY